MEHRDQAANCSSDDEGLAAALAENGSGSEVSGDDSDRRSWDHGYMVDGFLVRDDTSEDEVFSRVLCVCRAREQSAAIVAACAAGRPCAYV